MLILKACVKVKNTNTVGILNAIMNAKTLNSAWQELCDAMASYRFTRLMYGRSHFTSGRNLGDEADYMVLSNHDTEYFDFFIRSGRFKRSPFFVWSFYNTGFVSWSTVANLPKEVLATAGDLLEANERFGVTAGYTASFPNALPGHKSVASICASREMTQHDVDFIWNSYQQDLEAIWNAFDLKARSLPFPANEGRLTAKQREILGWIARGKTGQEIAIILGVTLSTVEKHLKSARDALDVLNTAQAVAKLSFMNQLHVDQDNEERVKAAFTKSSADAEIG